jgi:hypothetical protein
MAFPRCAAVCRVDRGQDADCDAAHVQLGFGCCRLSHYLFQSRPIQNRRMHCSWGDSSGLLVLLKNRSSAQIVTKFEPWLYV